MSEIAIEVRGLGKRYAIGGQRTPYRTLRESLTGAFRRRPAAAAQTTDRAFWALKDVSFDVARGEVVGIIGRNGAGKSTLLKVLSRITEPTEGGADINGRVGSLLEVGTGFHPELTGRENVFLNGAILGMRRSEIAAKFDEIIAFAETEKFLDTPVKFYSSGMYTRLAFAVAAHLDPEILIVDEVLAVGDAAFQKKCLGKMQDVAGQGRTVLFVSHSMPSVLRLCRTAVFMDRGRVVATGGAEEMTRLYLASGATRTAERTWAEADAPGDAVAKLKSVRMLDADGRLSETIDIERPSALEVCYWNYSSTAPVTVSVHFVNEDGTTLFSANDFSDPDWYRAPRTPGVVRSTVRVPPDLLAEGRVFVLAAVCTYNPNVVHGVEREAVSFQAVDRSTGRGVRGVYTGAWPGVVRPRLQWEVARDLDPHP